MDSLFGMELPLPMKFLIAFAIVLILIGTAAYLLRRFGTGTLAAVTQRNRQPRLAVVDATPIDSRRKLVIVRRDNVEHLLLIGGPTDVLVEPNIVRSGAQSARDTIRPASVEPLTLPEDGNWPLAPAQPAPRAEPVRAEQPVPVRPAAVHIPTTQAPPQVAAAPVAAAQHLPPAQQAPQQVPQPRMAPPAPPRAAAPAPVFIQPLPPEAPSVAPAQEFRQPPAPVAPPRPITVAAPIQAAAPEIPAATHPQHDHTHQDHAPNVNAAAPHRAEATVRAEPATPAALTQPSEPAAAEEQGFTNMAHRLEAALRPAVPTPAAALAPVPPNRPRATPAMAPVPPPRQQAPSYENLQREMANLLGRQPGGS